MFALVPGWLGRSHGSLLRSLFLMRFCVSECSHSRTLTTASVCLHFGTLSVAPCGELLVLWFMIARLSSPLPATCRWGGLRSPLPSYRTKSPVSSPAGSLTSVGSISSLMSRPFFRRLRYGTSALPSFCSGLFGHCRHIASAHVVLLPLLALSLVFSLPWVLEFTSVSSSPGCLTPFTDFLILLCNFRCLCPPTRSAVGSRLGVHSLAVCSCVLSSGWRFLLFAVAFPTLLPPLQWFRSAWLRFMPCPAWWVLFRPGSRRRRWSQS